MLWTYAQFTGPTSSQSAYVLPTAPVVKTASLLTVGDSIGGYRMVGIPDGLGAFDNGDGTFTLLMNHELGSTLGAVRAHGSKGAFVSKWIIDKSTLKVISGSDLMQQVFLWDAGTQRRFAAPTTFAFNRFCSGDLPAGHRVLQPADRPRHTRAHLHARRRRRRTGYQLATVVTGARRRQELRARQVQPEHQRLGADRRRRLGERARQSVSQDKTVVVANSDGGTGIMTNAVAVYVGTKQTTGTRSGQGRADQRHAEIRQRHRQHGRDRQHNDPRHEHHERHAVHAQRHGVDDVLAA